MTPLELPLLEAQTKIRCLVGSATSGFVLLNAARALSPYMTEIAHELRELNPENRFKLGSVRQEELSPDYRQEIYEVSREHWYSLRVNKTEVVMAKSKEATQFGPAETAFYVCNTRLLPLRVLEGIVTNLELLMQLDLNVKPKSKSESV
jgi:hypothetical protein